MGLPKFKVMEKFSEILHKGKYRVGDDIQMDMVVQYIRLLLDKSDESYMQGACDGFQLGQLKAMTLEKAEGFLGGPESKDGLGG